MSDTATATFVPQSFAWSAGAFELTGRWGGDIEALGRARLLVEVDGRRRSISAQGGQTAALGDGWRARFMSLRPSDEGTAALLKVAGLELQLPSPEVHNRPPPLEPAREPATAPAPAPARLPPASALPPAPVVRTPRAPAAAAADDVGSDEALLVRLRKERAAIDEARHLLERERLAAEQAGARLSSSRRPPDRPYARNTREPEYEFGENTMAFALAGVIAFLFLLVLIWIF